MASRSYSNSNESSVIINAPIERVFAYLDDHKALAGHMNESSMMMMGSKMGTEIDAQHGQAIGSKIRMHGSMMGMDLSLEEVITERQPPYRKTWETIGTPHLVVIDHYRMGFELSPRGESTHLRVFIEYDLPATGFDRAAGLFLGGLYARWCTGRMVEDAAAHFKRVVN